MRGRILPAVWWFFDQSPARLTIGVHNSEIAWTKLPDSQTTHREQESAADAPNGEQLGRSPAPPTGSEIAVFRDRLDKSFKKGSSPATRHLADAPNEEQLGRPPRPRQDPKTQKSEEGKGEKEKGSGVELLTRRLLRLYLRPCQGDRGKRPGGLVHHVLSRGRQCRGASRCGLAEQVTDDASAVRSASHRRSWRISFSARRTTDEDRGRPQRAQSGP